MTNRTSFADSARTIPGMEQPGGNPCSRAGSCDYLRAFIASRSTSGQETPPVRICSDDVRFYSLDHPGLDQCSVWKELRHRFATRGITWEAPCFGPSGYAFAARGYISGLAHLPLFLRVQPIYDVKVSIPSDDSPPGEGWKAVSAVIEGMSSRLHLKTAVDDALLATIASHTFTPSRGVYVCHHVPVSPDGERDFYEHFRSRNPGMSAYVGYTTFETDSIPSFWVDTCNRMDEIWVPSRFNLETFAAAGVDRTKLHVIPHGFDPGRYSPATTTPLQIGEPRAFTFLSIFEWTFRKGWDILIRAFIEEFQPDEDVRLLIRTYQGGGVVGSDPVPIPVQFERYIHSLGRTLSDIPSIQFIDRMIPDRLMPSLYRTADAFVLPTRGEGWGIPLTEAMLMEIPTIATRWSGHLDFMNDDNGYLIDIDGLEPVDDSQVADNPFYAGHRWARPSVSHLRNIMRELFEDPAAAREKARKGRATIVTRFSERRVALEIAERVRFLTGRFPNGKSVSGLPVTEKGRVLLQSQPEVLLQQGDRQAVFRSVKEFLTAAGYLVDHCSHETTYDPYDLVINLDGNFYSAASCLLSRRPYIVLPLFDYSEDTRPRFMTAFARIMGGEGCDSPIPELQLRLSPEYEFILRHSALAVVPTCRDRDFVRTRLPGLEPVVVDPLEIFAQRHPPPPGRQRGTFILCPGDLRPTRQQLLLMEPLRSLGLPVVFLHGAAERDYERALKEQAAGAPWIGFEERKSPRDQSRFYEDAWLILLSGSISGWEIADVLCRAQGKMVHFLAPDTPLCREMIGPRGTYYDPFRGEELTKIIDSLRRQEPAAPFSPPEPASRHSLLHAVDRLISRDHLFHLPDPSTVREEISLIMKRYRILSQASKGDPAALPELSRLVDEFPDDPVLRFHRGELLFMLNDDDAAERELSTAITLDPCRELKAYFMLSAIHICRGDGANAMKTIRLARALFPFADEESRLTLDRGEEAACRLL